MPMVTQNHSAKFAAKVSATLFENWTHDLEVVGGIAADEIIRTTLAGLGDQDSPFEAYSPAYQALMDAVGAKAGGVVDLRGVFFPAGQNPVEVGKTSRRRGGGRRAYVDVRIGGKSFTAKTRTTRPRVGIIDPLSEMSRDLITIAAKGLTVTITYRPRQRDYMILHQTGEARGGKIRKWFTLDKSAIRAAIASALTMLFKARIAAFNHASN